jgi:uroporphyrin-III C-methyltransferase/precorrin-2 dehydrogenase/sirohydrochlorin ferrochelatase
VLARRLRERIEATVPARVGELAALMGRYRRRVAEVAHSPRHFWQKVVDGPIGAAVLAGRSARAEADLMRSIDVAVRDARADTASTGTVFLVGAGPGDPDLLTLRALHVLQDADIVFYDELVTDAVLDRVRRDARRVFVGKKRGEPGMGQDEINRRLVEAALAGRKVVRLKGGDAFVFGRGGEEVERLRAHDIPIVIVPGITAALGCAAEAELPLTYRSEATRLSFVTAHRADEAAGVDWSGLTGKETTVVVYMGLASAAAVRDGLVKAGRDPATPAAVLARGTRPDSRAVVGRLDDLPKLAASVGEGPALLVIGEVVAHSAPWREALEFLNAQVAA